MCTTTKNIACTTAYLIGITNIFLYEKYYICLEVLNALKQDVVASKIRALCIIRTNLLMSFKKTDDALKYELKSLTQMEWFDKESVDFLKKQNIDLHIANGKAADYMTYVNQLINDNIDYCEKLYPEWVTWPYLKDLFVYNGWQNGNVQIKEFNKYQANREKYPNKMYIHWEPQYVGDLLSDDVKLLSVLYRQHNDEFTMFGHCKDADTTTKNSLNTFIESSDMVDLVVDCENSDVYKLYAMLKSIDQESVGKIHKIILFDDAHTTVGWDILKDCIDVDEIEHVQVTRVKEGKSLVDMRVAMGVSREYYQNNIQAFILVASDSDYWGIMSALPNAQFYCVTENEKLGKAMCELLDTHGIAHCTLDDFSTAEADKLKEKVLLIALEEELKMKPIVGLLGTELAHKLYVKAKIKASEQEEQRFYETVLRKVSVVLDTDGIFKLKY